ncbi:NEDD8 ultimate buster 1 [Drosophila guanche]|uniref:Blast:NEDD8 ultimate buster 1 n=1 Tax=Drosophila guanche TaxID=7266 RepID=A0A3B0JRE0_DROGU|nr:NEDD8 ultimate buster 1 [Drosophila guanche]SPP83553.1 blast:NEDD8 ultimate buster 1 [Drosophila guanche]
MSLIDNTLIKVHARLRERNIKLWEEPFYFEGIGSIESELERLAQEMSTELGISVSGCQSALSEIQNGRLRKLAASREFQETGLATFYVRCGTAQMMEIKCPMSGLGSELRDKVAQRLQLSGGSHIKIISAGRVLNGQQSLASQGLENHQQLMVVVGQWRGIEVAGERLQKIRQDILLIVASDYRIVDNSEKAGNPNVLPEAELLTLLRAISFIEKGRAAMFREEYDVALLLLLEGDEYFSSCRSYLPASLEAVDNCALINLDIVWCYLCLKNISQLPDAQRRLEICEKKFGRTYGDNLESFNEMNSPNRALIMRLHLLQGVVLFHMNRRDEAHERLELAADALAELKVDPELLQQMVDMGFNESDARVSLRATAGRIDRAVDFISERKKKLNEGRDETLQWRRVHSDGGGVCPPAVCRLIDMGFDQQLVVEALKRTKNHLEHSIELLQHKADELRANLPAVKPADEALLATLQQLGFSLARARVALETTENNLEAAIQFLLKMLSEEVLRSIIEAMTRLLEDQAASGSQTAPPALVQTVIEQAKSKLESYTAIQRFKAELKGNAMMYLDLPLKQEEQILMEYKNLLDI